MDTWGSALVGVAIVVGMFVVVPAGLRLVDGATWLSRLWLIAAVPGALSLVLPRGLAATLLAVAYALVTAVLAFLGAKRFLKRRSIAPRELAVLTAMVTPSIAGSSLVAERAGVELMGFDLDVLTLTVAHFHYTGFAAALIAGLVSRAAPGIAANAAALSVPGGTALVFLGYFTGDWVELVGAIVLTAGMWLVAGVTWQQIRPTATDALTRLLFGVSAVVLFGTMLLAISWALGEATGLAHLSLEWMAATHGLANAFGFALCAILAWRRFSPTPI